MDFILQLVTPSRVGAVESGFNPCFNGFHSPTRSIRLPRFHIHKVSILVLMDFILQRPHSCRLPMIHFVVSILVLMDFILQRLILIVGKQYV